MLLFRLIRVKKLIYIRFRLSVFVPSVMVLFPEHNDHTDEGYDTLKTDQ
jgi:hypothetical protein